MVGMDVGADDVLHLAWIHLAVRFLFRQNRHLGQFCIDALGKAFGRVKKSPRVSRVKEDFALGGVVDFCPNGFKPHRGFGGAFHDVMPLGEAVP